jgi:hypothetical protein
MFEKAIVYDPETRDFAMYLDGELVGFARTYQESESTLDELVYELLHGESFRASTGQSVLSQPLIRDKKEMR